MISTPSNLKTPVATLHCSPDNTEVLQTVTQFHRTFNKAYYYYDIKEQLQNNIHNQYALDPAGPLPEKINSSEVQRTN